MDIRLIDANALKFPSMKGKFCEVDLARIDGYHKAVEVVRNAPTLSLNTLRDAIYDDAVAHGLWEDKILLCDMTDVVTNEVMELLGAVSAVTLAETKKGKDKAQNHFNEELADVVIGCFSLAGKLGIDIDAAIRKKMEINKGRPWKHGKE